MALSYLSPHAVVKVFLTHHYFTAFNIIVHVCLSKNATIKGSLDVPLELSPVHQKYEYYDADTGIWKVTFTGDLAIRVAT